jgi:hypothetical protein
MYQRSWTRTGDMRRAPRRIAQGSARSRADLRDVRDPCHHVMHCGFRLDNPLVRGRRRKPDKDAPRLRGQPQVETCLRASAAIAAAGGQPAEEARRSSSRSACPESTPVRIKRATASSSATRGLVSE